MTKYRIVGRALLIVATMAGTGIPGRAKAISPAVRAVAINGQPAPGTPSGVVFRDFNPLYFSLNDVGQVAFLGFLTGPDVGGLDNEGIWSEGSGSLELIARKWNVAPGAEANNRFSIFLSPVLNNSGQTSFSATLIDINFSLSGNGTWSNRTGTLAIVAGTGLPAPGTPSGVVFAGVGGSLLNGAGQTAFRGDLSGDEIDGTNREGIWSEGSGGLMLVAREGSQAIGMPLGTVHDTFGLPALNDAGQTAFHGYLVDGGTPSNFGQAVWSEGSGSLALVARSGNQAPGTPNGKTFEGFSDPAFNNAGHNAFWAYLAGPAYGDPHDDGIWSEGPGGLMLVARRGSPAPGAQAGVTFGSDELVTFDSPVLSDSGDVAFRGVISGPDVDATNDEGIWAGKAGDLTLVARAGSHAPGTPPGVNFETFFPWNGALQMNALGQSVFTAFLKGDDVVFGNRIGIWATDIAGNLQLIARTGDTLEVAPGDFRTVYGLSFVSDGTGNSDGRPSGINNRGQIAFWARFDGGEGIFVSNLVAVPEPASLVLFILGLPLLVCRNALRKTERRIP